MSTPRKKPTVKLSADARRMNAIVRHFRALSLAAQGWTVGRLTSDFERAVNTAKHGND